MSNDLIDMERRVIGSVVRDPSLFNRAETIRCEDLEDPLCRDVWAAMRSLNLSGKAFGREHVLGSCMVATGEEIDTLARAGTMNVDRLGDAVVSLIDRKRRTALERDLIEHLGRLRDGAPWRETIAGLSNKLVTDYDGHSARTGTDVRAEMVRRLRTRQSKVVPTGLTLVDEYFDGGLPAGYLIGIGAQTKTGKTTLAATISGNWDRLQIPHIVHTLERHSTHIEQLKTATRLNINMNRLDSRLDDVERDPTKSSTYYVHNTQLSVDEWRHEVMLHVRRYGVCAAIVDYFQLFSAGNRSGRKDTRENELNRTVQVIANTAVDLEIPIILFSQNNETGEPRDCKAIKQAAGYYGVLHRDQDRQDAWIETIASSVSRFVNIGSYNHPAMTLDMAIGPHFRDDGERIAV